MSRRGALSSSRVQKATHYDSFDRADGGLGANWTVIQSGLAITSNRVSGSGGFSMHNPDVLTEDMYAYATIGPVTTGTLWLYVRTPIAGWPQVLAQFIPSSGNWTIITDPSNAGGNHTTRASGSVGAGVFVTGSVCRFEAVGNVYTLKHNGSAIGTSWTDSGAVITPGPTKRKCGLQLSGGSIRVDDYGCGDL